MAEIKAYNKTELAQLYGVSTKTLKAWLKPFTTKIGDYNGQRYTPKQIKIIFDCIDTPDNS